MVSRDGNGAAGPGVDTPDFLNLPGLKALSVRLEDGQYHILAEGLATASRCSRCGHDGLYAHGSRPHAYADVPHHGNVSVIHVDRKRVRCRACGGITLQPLPDMAETHMMTRRLVAKIERDGLQRTFSEVAREVGVHERTVRRIIADHIRWLEGQHRFETPRWLGLDEIHIIRRSRAVIANVEERCMVDMLPTRQKQAVGAYVQGMANRDRIELVCMDMWAPYRDIARELLPRAQIVVDKFHVVRMATAALETVRKRIRSDLTTKRRLRLKDDRFLLLRRAQDLAPQQLEIIAGWTREFPDLGAAWNAKEGFCDLWDARLTPAQAKTEYAGWVSSLDASVREAFRPLLTALKNWEAETFAYFQHPVTNAYTEALNGVIRVVNRVGRGYSFEVLRAKMLFAHGRHAKRTVPIIRERPEFGERVAGFLGTGAHPHYPSTRPSEVEELGVPLSVLADLIEREVV
jgi:transposase